MLLPEVRRELSERYGVGVIRQALRECMEAGVIRTQPVEVLAHVYLAALLEAATLVAEGVDRAEVGSVLETLLDSLVNPARVSRSGAGRGRARRRS